MIPASLSCNTDDKPTDITQVWNNKPRAWYVRSINFHWLKTTRMGYIPSAWSSRWFSSVYCSLVSHTCTEVTLHTHPLTMIRYFFFRTARVQAKEASQIKNILVSLFVGNTPYTMNKLKTSGRCWIEAGRCRPALAEHRPGALFFLGHLSYMSPTKL